MMPTPPEPAAHMPEPNLIDVRNGVSATARPGVDAAVNRLAAATDSLDSVLSVLNARLGPVLGSGTPHATPPVDPAAPVGDSQLVEAITTLASRIEGARQHVESLLNRLEV